MPRMLPKNVSCIVSVLAVTWFVFSFFPRHKNLKQRVGSAPGLPLSISQPSQLPSKVKVVDKPEKAEKQQKRPQTPFHHRSFVGEDLSMEPEDRAGHYHALHHSEDAPSKAQTLHTSSRDMAGSPQPPPLSPHPCEREEETATELKRSSTPLHEQFYPSSSEPCLLPPKSPAHPSFNPLTSEYPATYPDSQEPTVYVGSAINPNEDTSHNPWRYFRLPGKRSVNLAPPQLPVDKLKQDNLDSAVSVTE